MQAGWWLMSEFGKMNPSRFGSRTVDGTSDATNNGWSVRASHYDHSTYYKDTGLLQWYYGSGSYPRGDGYFYHAIPRGSFFIADQRQTRGVNLL